MIFRHDQKKKISHPTAEQLELINQEMYKRNADLANKNKLLSLLHQLYSITARTLDIPELSQNLIRTIVTTMDFPFVGMCVVDHTRSSLIPVAAYCSAESDEQLFASTKRLTTTFQKGAHPFVRAWKSKRRGQCRQAKKHLLALVDEAKIDALNNTHIAVMQSIPLVSDKQVIGVLCIGLSTSAQDMTRFEKDTITNLISITSIALDKALIYDALKVANLRLQELDQQKTEFLSIASHQLRTPLSIIKGYIELLQDGAYGKLTQKAIGILDDMDQSNERLVKLVDEFLNISRIEQDRTKFAFAKAPMTDLIDDVFHELHKRAEDKGLTIEWDSSNISMPPVLMDAEKIRHVIFNFIDNAIKYSNEGLIRIFLEKKNDGIVVRVTDEGLGFSKKDQLNLFQKFYRGMNVRQTNVNGTGLGIYVCRKFIEAHSGTVWAKSRGIGKGSEFGFCIPITRKRRASKTQ